MTDVEDRLMALFPPAQRPARAR